MSQYSFDDFDNYARMGLKDQKPIWTLNLDRSLESDEDLLRWLKTMMENKKLTAQPRIRNWRDNVALYKGIHYRTQEVRNQDFRRDMGDRTIRNPKVVVNHIYNMVETKVAKMSRFRPAVAVLPINDEWDDKCNVKTVKMLVDNRWYEVDIDGVLRNGQRAVYIYGTSFIKVIWDKDIGPLHPYAKQLKAQGVPMNALTQKGETIEDREGKPIVIERDIRVGDVKYEILTPDFVYPEEKYRWEDVTELTEVYFRAIEEVKSDYPELQDKIHVCKDFKFDLDTMEDRSIITETRIHETWVKPHKYMPRGAWIKWTDDVILEVTEFPYEHGELPYLPWTDIDVPNECMGRSFISNIRQLQRHFNNLASGIARNHGLASAPKWIMPAGACRMQDLSNDATVVEFKGPMPPVLQSMNPTGVEIFAYMKELRQMIMEGSEVAGISMGQPPAGIRAGVALQFLDEQEQERQNNGVAKRNTIIRNLFKMTAATMRQFYNDEDDRMIRIIGKDNTYLLKPFKKSDLTEAYDVRMQNSSSLPDSKASKIQTILDLKMGFPTMLKDEQVVEMLDLGTSEAFIDRVTVAVKSAESENEAMLSGQGVIEPKPWEDLINHYDIHLKSLQERAFKEEVPSDYQNKLIEHVKATEYLMVEKAKRNGLFLQKLMMTFDQFPIFFAPDEQFAMMLRGPMGAPPPMGSGAPAPGGNGLVPPVQTGTQENPGPLPEQSPIGE